MFLSIILLILLLLNLPNTSSQSCTTTDPNCQTCLTTTTCKYCITNYRVSSQKCVPCTSNYCQSCDTSWSTCIQCSNGYYLTSGNCYTCGKSNCITYVNNSPNNTNQCKCSSCSNISLLNSSTSACQLCTYPCLTCSLTLTHCTSCQFGGLTTSYTCLNCTQTVCLACTANNQKCTSCTHGYPLVNYSCIYCDNITTIDCGINFLICTACNLLNYQNGNNICRLCSAHCISCVCIGNQSCILCSNRYYLISQVCQPCIPYCNICLNGQTCQQCNPGSYRNTIDQSCYLCPHPCTLCYFIPQQLNSSCTQCQPYYQLTISEPLSICNQICGDMIVLTYPCDYLKYQYYDGCTPNCQVQDNFTCNIDINISTCSYTKQLIMEILSLKEDPITNTFTMKVTIYPPLFVLTQIDLKEVFKITNPQVKVNSISFNQNTKQLLFHCNLLQNILNQSLTITFQPQPHLTKKLTQTPSSQTTLPLFLPYYPPLAIFLIKIIPYLSIAVVLLQYIGLLLGIFTKRLQGLQAVIVGQFAYFVGLWCQGPMYQPLGRMYPMKLSTGINIAIFNTNSTFIHPPGNSFIHPTRPNTPYPYTSFTSPHVLPFSIDTFMLSNNINIFLTPQLLTSTLILFGILLIKCCIRYQNSINIPFQSNRNQQQSNNEISYEQRNKNIQMYILKISNIVSICYRCLMYSSMLNLTNYVGSTILYFKYNSHNLTNYNTQITNYFIFIIPLLSYIFTYFILWSSPGDFHQFIFAFKLKKPDIFYYFFYSFTIIGSIILLVLLPEFPYLPMIPFVILLIFNFWYKPYRTKMENYRAIFNLVTIMILLGFRIYTYFQKNIITNNKTQLYIYLLINIILLILTPIIAIITIIYNIIKTQSTSKKIKKTENQIIKQLQLVTLRSKIKDIGKQCTTFRKIIHHKNDIYRFSNQIHQKYLQTIGQKKNNNDQINTDKNKQHSSITQTKQNQCTNQAIITNQHSIIYPQPLFPQPLINPIIKTSPKLPKKSKHPSTTHNIQNNIQQKFHQYQKQQQQSLSSESEQKNKKIIALRILTNENKYIRYKNVTNYTEQAIQIANHQKNYQIYMDNYQDIDKIGQRTQ